MNCLGIAFLKNCNLKTQTIYFFKLQVRGFFLKRIILKVKLRFYQKLNCVFKNQIFKSHILKSQTQTDPKMARDSLAVPIITIASESSLRVRLVHRITILLRKAINFS
jgi:hypothetical protein